MKLKEALEQVETLGVEEVIFCKRPWVFDAEALVGKLTQDYQVPAELRIGGYEYFLDVPIALEVLSILKEDVTSKEVKGELLLYYAQNDAYPDWVYSRGLARE